MRRFDKKHNIEKANLLAEQRYLASKGLIKEDETAPYDADKQSGGLYEGDKDMLFEERFNDLFKFLDAKDPQKMSQGNAYYTAPLGDSYMNKYVKDEEGNKKLNPYYGRILKHTRFMFGWADTYKRAEERRTGGDVELGARSGQYDKVKGYDVLEKGKSGHYLPILPTGSDEYTFTCVDDNGNQEPIEEEKFQEYMKPPRPSNGKSKFRPLIINRISKIQAGGNKWINPEPEFKYMGPGEVNEDIVENSNTISDFDLMANLIVTRIASKEVDSKEFFDYLKNNKEEVLNFVSGLKDDIPENPYLKILMLNPKESLRLLNP